MKKAIKAAISLLLSAISVLTLSSCIKQTKKKQAEEEPRNISQETTSESVNNNFYIDSVEENTNVPETTVIVETQTLPPARIESNTTNNYELNITSSDYGFEISEELREKIERTIINFDEQNVAFSLYDIDSDVSIQYNETEGFNGACIVKPGVVLYLLKKAENNELDLTEELEYPGNLVSGSGYLDGYYNGYQAYTGQEFTLLELMYHALYYSDNNAYSMLHSYMIDNGYYYEYRNMMSQIGATSLIVPEDSIWVRQAESRDGIKLILALNSFINTSQNGMNVDRYFVNGENLAEKVGKVYLTYGEILYQIMIDGKYDYLENCTGITCLTKTGFVSGSGSLSCRNIISLCYGDHLYAICLLTKYNDEDYRKEVVDSLLVYLNEVMIEYNEYRKNSKKLVLG